MGDEYLYVYADFYPTRDMLCHPSYEPFSGWYGVEVWCRGRRIYRYHHARFTADGVRKLSRDFSRYQRTPEDA